MNFLKYKLVYLPIIIFVLSFSLYSYTAARTITGYGDSDEIITISYLLGVAHPSGYALTVILTNLFLKIFLPFSIAFKAQLFAGLTHSLALAILGIGIFKFLKITIPQFSDFIKSIVTILISFIAGTSGLYWLYAGVLEVNALNMLFFALTVFAFISWYESNSRNQNSGKSEFIYFYLMAIATGLGLSNVHTFILIIPGTFLGILSTLYFNKKIKIYFQLNRILIFIGLFLLSWLMPNVMLWWLNGREVDFSWFFDQSFTGWWQLILRRDYAGTVLDQGGRQISAYISIKSFNYYIQNFVQYFVYLSQHFSPFALMFSIFGILYSWKINRAIFITFFSWWFISGPVLGSYMGFPTNPTDLEFRTVIGIAHRQLILSELALGLVIVLGIISLIKEIKFKNSSILILSLLLITLFNQILGNFEFANQRNYFTARDYVVDLLDTPESNAVIICHSDISCFSLMYMQLVENYRPDVIVLTKNNLYQKYFLKRNVQFQSYTYSYNPFFTADLISWNAVHRPTYLVEPDGYYIDHLGLDANPWYLIPKGLLLHVTDQIPAEIDPPSLNFQKKLLEIKISNKNYLANGLKDYFTQKNNVAATYYAKMGYLEHATDLLAISLKLSPKFQYTQQVINSIPDFVKDARFQYGSKSPSANQIFEQYKNELLSSQKNNNNEQLMQAYKTLLKASYRDPKDLEIRSELARLYYFFGYYPESITELKRILKFDPENQFASELLIQAEKSLIN